MHFVRPVKCAMAVPLRHGRTTGEAESDLHKVRRCAFVMTMSLLFSIAPPKFTR